MFPWIAQLAGKEEGDEEWERSVGGRRSKLKETMGMEGGIFAAKKKRRNPELDEEKGESQFHGGGD